MISYIQGELAETLPDRAVIDVHGVGYGILMPVRSLSNLPNIGGKVKVYTYMNVREDAVALFGFLTRDDLGVFKQLITVSGIGPKGGLGILSVLTADELRRAVLSGDVRAITAAPGIGKKTAEKIILELKDKFKIEDVFSGGEEGDLPGSLNDAPFDGAKNEAVQALVALGYGYSESLKAVKKVALEDPTPEKVLREALKNII